MSYFESAEGVTISRKRAIKEVLDHHCDLGEFNQDMGIKATYLAQDVLAWLGY